MNKLLIWYIFFIGFKSIFTRAENVWCTQHLEKNDLEQVRYYCSNDKDRRKIMPCIYNSQNEVLLQERLADTIDNNYFKAKLASLKPAWKVIAPEFHCWFKDNCFPPNALSWLPGRNIVSSNGFLQMR